ncbi:hsp90 co-chaperone Cdc37 [Rhagoletis pomonella]|uniref:hsp90 co-chaperone Cdc37 n=1 Tax=Rhagoletis pomonella TaxID=28610 RepID=UPI00177BEF7A|nr:hsp90 co-chaperone Cdc37 [Rhagoletis pomonella]
MAEMEREKEEFKKKKQSCQARLMDVKERIQKKKGDETELKKELEKIQKEGKELDRLEEELIQKEKKAPWNVDTISKPGFEKTVLNKQAVRKSDENLTEEEKEARMKKFVKENEKLCKQYGMLRKYDDSKRFLQQHLDLVCEETANYLVIWSINLEMEEKHDLMAHVAHQCICMQYILELAKQLEIDPRACVSSFFSKIQNCVPEYREQFENEIEGFKGRIRKRAQEKIQEALVEAEEEERKARLGPGGLDPAEVFETLPESLQKCFESRDIELLQKAIAELPVEEAKYHMKRCVDSGLWVPNAADAEIGATEEKDAEADVENADNGKFKSVAGGGKLDKTAEEPIYTGVNSDDLD